MGTIAEKLTYLNTTKIKLRDSLNKFGSSILSTDTFRSYDTKLNAIYDKLPKVTTTGQGMTIYDVQNGYLDDFKMNGTDLYQNTLPNEYQAVEYIESTGTQYIDTGIKTGNNIKMSVEAINTFGKTDASQPYGGALFGARESSSNSNYCYVTGSLNDFVGTGSGYNQITKNTNNRLLKIDYDNSSAKITCGNYNYTASFSIDITNSYNIYLFALNQENTVPSLGTFKLYSCKIYENNILSRDFVPCYRKSDNEIGLYDFITNTFFTNQGTGTFVIDNLTTVPNPDYPQTIKVVEGRQVITDKGKNLLNIPDGTYSSNGVTAVVNKGVVTLNGTANSNSFIKFPFIFNFEDTKTYTLSANNEEVVGGSNYDVLYSAIRFELSDDDGGTSSVSTWCYFGTQNNSRTININYNAARFCIRTGAGLTYNNFVIKPQLEEGSTATDNEPYYEPVSYNIDLHGKNIFDGQYEDGYYNVSNGTKQSTHNPDGRRSTNLNELKSNTNYIISINNNIISETIRLFYYDANRGFISTELISSGTFTTPAECYYVSWHSSALKQNYPDGIPNMMIEQGNVATTFEEYYNYKLAKMPNTTYKNKIYRNNGNWYYEKNIEKIILDGYVNLFSSKKGNPGNVYAINQISNLKSTSSNDEVVNAISNYFIADAYSNLDNLDNGIVEYHDSHEIRFKFGVNSSITTLKLANEWLQNNNVLLYYALATPVTTQITNATLINQLEAISVHTGTNIFTISNDNNMIPELEITRLKELEKLS